MSVSSSTFQQPGQFFETDTGDGVQFITANVGQLPDTNALGLRLAPEQLFRAVGMASTQEA